MRSTSKQSGAIGSKRARQRRVSTTSTGVDTIRAWIVSVYEFSDPHRLDCPFWPPDLFAVVGSILRRTGSYCRIYKTPAPFRNGRRRVDSKPMAFDSARKTGDSWRRNIQRHATRKVPDLSTAIPKQVLNWWKVLSMSFNSSFGAFDNLADGSSTCPIQAAISLVIAADQASAGVGISHHVTRDSSAPIDFFLMFAHQRLSSDETLFRSLCLRIPPERLAVLPKQHTPQTGLTFRSLTHHLALCPSGEIQARWYGPTDTRTRRSDNRLNILILPWPLEVLAADFQYQSIAATENPKTGAFTYAPRSMLGPKALADWVKRSINCAMSRGATIDVVVFPEASLNLMEYYYVEKAVVKAGCMLIAGVRLEPRDSNAQAPVNSCALQTRGLFDRSRTNWELLESTRYVQTKHHRWLLDPRQIMQYGLGTRLPADRAIWENIALPSRPLNFINLDDMTWCALICEDLARQEPASEIMRAVAPNMVVALLMDGPQHKDRWSARYASGLADDPGSSVLTVTNLGFVLRSKRLDQSNSVPRDAVIALWRDAIGGPQEIDMRADHTACVLTLVVQGRQEYSADGRGDGGNAYHPTYAGHESFRVDPRYRA